MAILANVERESHLHIGTFDSKPASERSSI